MKVETDTVFSDIFRANALVLGNGEIFGDWVPVTLVRGKEF